MSLSMRIAAFAAVMATAFAAVAQDPGLSTEITVDREIIPEHIDATRLRVAPELSLPAVSIPKLQIADRTRAASIDPYVANLAPSRYGMTTDSVPWRGYVEAGFLPVDYTLSAGYGFKVSDSTRLNAFLQFDGIRYKADIPVYGGDGSEYCKDYMHRNALNVGATSRTDFKGGGYVDAYLMFGGAAYNIPWVSYPWLEPSGNNLQGFKPLNHNDDADMRNMMTGVTFGAKAGKWNFDGGLHYKYFSLGVNDDSRAENSFVLDFKPSYSISGTSLAGIDLAVKGMGANAGFRNRGVVRVAPHYEFSTQSFKARLGVSVDAKLGNAKCSALFAPDVSVSWIPSQYLTVWGKMHGALDANWLSSLYDFTPYLPWEESFGYSRIPIDTKVGVTIGPLTGLSLELRAGFASVEDWLVCQPNQRLMAAEDASSLSFGATLAYRYGSTFDMSVSADFYSNPDGYGYPYHIGTTVASDVQLRWRPIDRLTINAGFSYRQHDKTLGDPLNLSAGVVYRFNNRLSAFLRGENLTGSRYYIVYCVPAQRFHGLAGVTYLF